MQRSGSELDLPGFRFHPTDEELLDFYLRRAASGKKLHFDIIGTLNLYRYDPWDLPGLAKIGEKEWYFFVPRDRKQRIGGRPNRTTERGFWKATGSEQPIRCADNPKQIIGLKKTLVYYNGRAPRGCKTEWVMNEYRLPEIAATARNINSSTLNRREDIVLCKIYRKATSMKELEQRAAIEEEEERLSRGSSSTPEEAVVCSDHENLESFVYGNGGDQHEKMMEEVQIDADVLSVLANPTDQQELQIPMLGLDWIHDPFLTQFGSPELIDQWSHFDNILNF